MSLGGGRARIVALVLAIAFVAAMAYLLVHAIGGEDLAEEIQLDGPVSVSVPDRHEVLPALIVGSLAGLLGLAGFALTSRAGAEAEKERARREAADEAREREEEARARMGSELEESRSELAQAEAERGRMRQAAHSQRDWIRRLRGEVTELQRNQGALGGMDDVRALVLRVAVLLLEADMGLLMSRRDEDGDGSLDLVASEGFDNDPADSVIVERFAREVVKQDTTVRESGDALKSLREAPADYEIENLIAIPIYIDSDNFEGVVVCLNSTGYEEHPDDVLVALGDHAGAILQNAKLHTELRGSYLDTVRVLAEAIEVKDPFLRGHSEEVSGYVARVADELGIEPKRREELVFGSLLHDVGKLGISERILLKPGPLTAEEFAVIQLHPRIGYRLIQNVALLRSVAPAILHHHERYDGDGYPAGLKGEQIPLEARIICVADAFSAMTSERPYQRRKSLDEACEELERSAGTQFDPRIVRLFVEEVRKQPRRREGDRRANSLLDDPELGALRGEDEPLLGYGSFAITDNLTLLYSHRYLHEVVRAEAERVSLQGGSFAVVIAEITNITELNREHGYASGDQAIREVAGCVQRVAVRHGASAARFSGRRLAMLVPEADDAMAREVAREVNDGVDASVSLRFASAVWVPGESGEDVIARVRVGLEA